MATNQTGSYHNTKNCTSVTASCPVDLTVYGYYPSLPANAFFCAFFSLFLLIQLLLGFRFRTWVFSCVVSLGCLSEAIGYVGRVLMHGNPWSNAGFEMQICTLIIAPSFFAAAIYITLRYMVSTIGAQYSPIKASLYPWIFMTCDLISLLLQAAGGATAATANNASTQSAGGRIMLAGIVFQVATFTVLYILAGIFISKLLRQGKSTMTAEAKKVLQGSDFKVFAVGILVASLVVYIRCIYRIAELAQGWANSVMRDQNGFIVFDGLMCCIAVLALTIAHPGVFFKPMTSKAATEEKSMGSEQYIVEV